MKRIYYLLLSLIFIINFHAKVVAQCPDGNNTEATINFADALCFGAENGTISFELRDGGDLALNPTNFSYSLYDGGENDYVYDDIGITPGGDVNPAINLNITGNVIEFSNLPTTKDGIGYTIAVRRNDGTCGAPDFFTQGILGIIINEPAELIATVDTKTDDCNNTDSGEILLDVTGGTGAYSFSWTGPTVIGDTDNPTGLSAGSYDVTVTDDNGCTFDLTGIVVSPGPDAGLVGSANACNNDGGFDLFTVLTGTPDATGTFTAAGTNPEAVTVSGTGNTSTADFTGVAAGDYIFTYTVSAAGCTDATADVTITVTAAPDAGLAGSADACNNDGAFNIFDVLTGTPSTTGTFTAAGTNPAAVTLAGTGNTTTADFTGLTAGTYVFTYTVTATGCADATADVTITLSDAPDAGLVGSANACNNDGGFDLFTVLTGTPDATGTFTAAGTNPEAVTVSGTGNTSTADFTGVAAGDYIFTYTVSAAGCTDATADVTITVTAAPDAGLAGSADACNNDGAFNIFDVLTGTPSTTGTFTAAGTNPAAVTLAGTGNTTTADFTGLTAGTYVFTYTVTATGCADATADVTITLSDAPDAGLVGSANACNNDGGFDLFTVLTGTPDATGTFTAAGTNPEAVTVSGTGNTSTADFTGVAAGDYIFTYTVSAAGCTDATADVTITVTAAPDAGLAGSADACNNDGAFNIFDVLTGTPSTTGTFTAAGTNPAAVTLAGTGITTTADFTGLIAGTYVFTYTVTATGCADATADVTITLSDAPDAGLVGSANACNNDGGFDLFTVLTGTPDATGTFTAAGTNPEAVTVSGTGNTSTADFTGVAAGDYIFTYTVSAAGCTDATADVTITVTAAPDAGLAGSADACNNDGAFNIFDVLTGTPSTTGTFTAAGTNPAAVTLAGTGNTTTADFTGLTAGTYVFTYTVTATGCADATADVTITLSDAPDAGLVGSANACNNDGGFDLFTVLTGTPDATGTFTAAGTNPEAVTVSGTGNTSTADFTGVAAGDYIFTYTVSAAGCTDATADVTITVTAAPDAGLAGSADACNNDGAFNIFDVLTGTPSTTGTFTAAGTNPAAVTLAGTGNTTTADFTGLIAGTYVFTYTVTATGCADATADVTITLSDAPDAGLVGSANACNNDGGFDLFTVLTGTPDATGTFTAAGTNPEAVTVSGTGNTSTADFTGVAAGDYIFTYTVSAAGCTDATADVTITLTAAPDAGLAGSSDACNNDGAFNIFDVLTGTPSTTGTFTAAGTNPAAVTLAGTGITTTADFTGLIAGTYVFTYTVTATGCADATADVTITLSDAPDAGLVGSANACNNDGGFDLFTVLTGTPDATGTFTAAGTNPEAVTVSGTGNTSTADFTGVAAGDYIFTYTVSAAGCTDATADVTITVTTAPDAGLAGSSDACNNDGAFNIFDVLTGTPSTTGTFTAAGTNPAAVTLAGTGNTTTADFTGLIAGTYVFTYTVTATGCADATADVTITLSDAPDAGLVGSANACNNDGGFDLFTVLTGTPDATGTFTAAGTNPEAVTVSGTGNTSTADFTGVAAGDYIFTYTVSAAGCTDATADVTITVTAAPDAGLAGSADACNNDGAFNIFDVLTGTPSTTGTFTAAGTNPAAVTLAGTGNTTTADFTGLTAGTYVFTYTVTATGCADATADVTITLSDAPDAGLVGSANACNNDGGFDLFTVLTGTPDATGTFTAAGTNPEAVTVSGTGNTSTADFTGVAAGDYIFTYTVSAAGCTDATADVTITVTAAPDAGLAGSADACNNDGAFNIFDVLTGTPSTTGTFTAAGTNPAAVTLAGTGNTTTADFTGLTAGTYVFTYTVTATGCADATADVTITLSDAPDAGLVGSANACNNDGGFDLFTVLTGTPDATGTFTAAGTNPEAVTVSGTGNTSTADFTGVAAGDYIFTYTVSAAGCTDATADVTITVTAAPDAGLAGSADACNNDGAFNIFDVLTGTPSTTGTFTAAGTNPAAVTLAGTGNTTTADFTGLIAGTYVFTYTVTATGCADATADVTITLSDAPDAGLVGSANACNNDGGFDLFTVLTGTPDATGTFTAAGTNPEAVTVSGTGNTSTADFTGVAAGDYIFTYTVSAAGCTDATADVTITLTAAPDAGLAGSSDACNNDGAFNIFDVLTGTPSTTGTFTAAGTNPAAVTLAGTGNTTTADFTGLTAGTYVFTYTVTATGCADATADVTITLSDAPDAGLVGSANACNNDGGFDLFTVLTGTPDATGTFTAAGTNPEAVTVSGTGNTSTADFTGVAAGDYIFTYTVSAAGCTDATADVTITVTAAPDAGLAGSADACNNDGAFNIFDVLTGTPSTTGTFTAAGTNPAAVTLAGTGNTTTADFTGLTAGTYVFTYTVTATGCADATADVTITLSDAPDAGLVGSANACNNDGGFDLFTVLTGTPDATGTFTAAGTNPEAVTVSGTGNTSTADFTGVAAGDYIFTYTVSAAGCTDATADVTITVTAAPDAGLAGSADVCNNDGAFNIFDVLTGTPSTTGTFTAAGTNPAAVTLAGTGITTTADFTGLIAGTYVFTYTVTATGCADATADVTITLSDAPDAGLVGSANACNNDGGFDLFTVLTGTPDATGTFTAAGTNPEAVTVSGTGNTSTADFTGVAAGDYIFTYTVSAAGCTDATADVTITVTTAPDAGLAGSSDACNNDGAFNIFDVLTGTPSTTGTFTAAGTNPAAVTLAGTGNTTTADFTGLIAGTYVFTYTVTATGCADATADVTITLSDAPDAGLVGSANACNNDGGFDLFTVLTGTPDATGTFTAAGTNPEAVTVSGTGNTSTADFTGVAAGDYIFTYTVSAAGCTDATADVTITVTAAPDAGLAGSADACNNDGAFNIFDVLTGTPSTTGTFTAAGTNPAAVTLAGTGNTTTADFTGLTAGTYVFTYTVTATGCADATADVTITLSDAPTVDAGLDSEICSNEVFNFNDLAIAAQPTASNVDSIRWETLDGDGVFGDIRNLLTTYTPGAQDSIDGFATLRLTGIGASTCSNAVSEMTLTINPAAFAEAGSDSTLCDAVDFDLSTLDTTPSAINGTIQWTSAEDGNFDVSTAEQPVYTFGATEIANGSAKLYLTVTGAGSCSPVVDSVMFSLGTSPVFNTPLADAEVCYGDTLNITIDVDGFNSLLWTSNPAGGNFVDATIADAQYIPSAADSLAGSVDLILTLTGGGACDDVSDTLTVTINSLGIILDDNNSVLTTSGCGVEDGSIDITVTGRNSGDFSFLWTGPTSFVASTEDIADLGGGTYFVQVTDNISGCIARDTFDISNPIPFDIDSVDPNNQTQCGIDDGSIAIAISGSTGDINYHIKEANNAVDTVSTSAELNSSNETYAFNQLAPGDYKLFIENGGCVDSVEFTIDPVESISATVSSELASCGSSDGSISVKVSQINTNTYDLVLKNTAGDILVDSLGIDVANDSVVFEGLARASYIVIVTDNITTCSDSLNIDVNEDAPFTPDDPAVTNIQNCGDFGSISLTFADTNEPTSYAWFNSENDTISTATSVNGLEAGVYGVELKDANCTVVIRDIEITQPAECDYDCEDFRVSPITEAATCLGVNDGKLFFLLRNVNNSSPELNFEIKQAGADDSLYNRFTVDNIGRGLIVELDTSLATGTYTVVASDPNLECVSDTFNINIGTKTTLSASIDIEQPTCTVATGSISATIAGTNNEFEYILYYEGDSLTSNNSGVFAALEEGDYELEFNNQNSNACGLENRTFTIENTAVVDQNAVDIDINNPECGEIFGEISVSLNNLPSNYEFILVNGAGEEVARNATGIFNEVPEGTYVIQFENVVDPGACPIADRGGVEIENNGAFSASASDVENIVCHGDSTGTVVITLEGISSGFYSYDNGQSWFEFTSGNRITGLPAVNNVLISDEEGTSDCELSIAVGIEYLSDPIELDGNGGQPQIVNEASCDESEADGIIQIPEIIGGVEPYSFQIDGNTVELDENRQITGLNKLSEVFTIIDDSGCSRDFEINNILAPNQIGASVVEINEDVNQCLLEPEGIQVTLRTFTVNNIPGPFTIILNRSDEEETVELPLNVENNNGDSVFFVGPNYDLNYTFEKGQQYNWTIRTTNSEQSCSTDGTIRIDDGAVIPTFDVDFIDVACFNSNGFIELSNIVANNTFPLSIQVSKNGEIRETFTYNDFELNDSFTISTNELLDQDNPNEPDGGTYNVLIYQEPQEPETCNSLILSEEQSGIIEEPTSELRAELVPEPNLPPGTARTRNDMNPIPTSRETTSDGSISIRLTSTTGSPNGLYYADLNLVEPIGNNSRADYTGILVDSVLFGSDESITFEGLLPGIYEIVFYDEFGCEQNNKIIGQEGDFQITVDYDRRPFIPNVFTPNNDGKNDFFAVLNLPDNGAELIVTNRNGTIVYRNDSYGPSDRETNLWDGGDSPDGIYFYQLTVNGTVQSGWVEILRGRR